MIDLTNCLQDLIVFSLIAKTIVLLCPKKRIREYAKALMGIYLAILFVNQFLLLFSVDLKTKYCEELNRTQLEWEQYMDLFTIEEENKSGFDIEESESENVIESQENSGFLDAEGSMDDSSKVSHVKERNEISTIHVENIQSIIVK